MGNMIIGLWDLGLPWTPQVCQILASMAVYYGFRTIILDTFGACFQPLAETHTQCQLSCLPGER